jgi:hypothetical protein
MGSCGAKPEKLSDQEIKKQKSLKIFEVILYNMLDSLYNDNYIRFVNNLEKINSKKKLFK